MNQRELKFRAWNGEEMIFVHQLDIYPDSKICRVNCSVQSHYDKWHVMQFTGLKDKHGKEIYEGDIVLLEQPNRKYTVEFSDYCFKLIHADPKLQRMEWGGIHRIKELSFTVEKIGNIYEDKHLLK